MNLTVAYLLPHTFEERSNVLIHVPAIYSAEWTETQRFQAFGDAQVVPPADLLLVRVIGP